MICVLWSLKLEAIWGVMNFFPSHDLTWCFLNLTICFGAHWRDGWIESRDHRWDRVVLIRWRQRNPKYPFSGYRRRCRRCCCCLLSRIIFTNTPPPLSIAFYTFLFVRSFSSVSSLVDSVVLSRGSILNEVRGDSRCETMEVWTPP